MEIRRRKRSTKDIVFDTIIAIFLIIFVIITLYPIINTLAVSFNDGIDSVRGEYIYGQEYLLFKIIKLFLQIKI